jgi:hypothetical protein
MVFCAFPAQSSEMDAFRESLNRKRIIKSVLVGRIEYGPGGASKTNWYFGSQQGDTFFVADVISPESVADINDFKSVDYTKVRGRSRNGDLWLVDKSKGSLRVETRLAESADGVNAQKMAVDLDVADKKKTFNGFIHVRNYEFSGWF